MTKIDKITACLSPIVAFRRHQETNQSIEFLYLVVVVVLSRRDKNVKRISPQSTRLLRTKAEMNSWSKIHSRLDRRREKFRRFLLAGQIPMCVPARILSVLVENWAVAYRERPRNPVTPIELRKISFSSSSLSTFAFSFLLFRQFRH
jgi:hypothetical protein